MFQILDLFIASSVGLAMLVGDLTLFASDSYSYPKDREAVVAIEGARSRMAEDGKGVCVFKGILVPFSRDWEETQLERGETKVIPGTSMERKLWSCSIRSGSPANSNSSDKSRSKRV